MNQNPRFHRLRLMKEPIETSLNKDEKLKAAEKTLTLGTLDHMPYLLIKLCMVYY